MVPFHSDRSAGFAKLYKNDRSRENQHENVANKEDIKHRLKLKRRKIHSNSNKRTFNDTTVSSFAPEQNYTKQFEEE